jgi:hypothetical protein
VQMQNDYIVCPVCQKELMPVYQVECGGPFSAIKHFSIPDLFCRECATGLIERLNGGVGFYCSECHRVGVIPVSIKMLKVRRSAFPNFDTVDMISKVDIYFKHCIAHSKYPIEENTLRVQNGKPKIYHRIR